MKLTSWKGLMTVETKVPKIGRSAHVLFEGIHIGENFDCWKDVTSQINVEHERPFIGISV